MKNLMSDNKEDKDLTNILEDLLDLYWQEYDDALNQIKKGLDADRNYYIFVVKDSMQKIELILKELPENRIEIHTKVAQ